jgi:hypothetical protein
MLRAATAVAAVAALAVAAVASGVVVAPTTQS